MTTLGSTRASADPVDGRSRRSRRCPKCGRDDALRFHRDLVVSGEVCRFCDHEDVTIRTDGLGEED